MNGSLLRNGRPSSARWAELALRTIGQRSEATASPPPGHARPATTWSRRQSEPAESVFGAESWLDTTNHPLKHCRSTSRTYRFRQDDTTYLGQQPNAGRNSSYYVASEEWSQSGRPDAPWFWRTASVAVSDVSTRLDRLGVQGSCGCASRTARSPSIGHSGWLATLAVDAGQAVRALVCSVLSEVIPGPPPDSGKRTWLLRQGHWGSRPVL